MFKAVSNFSFHGLPADPDDFVSPGRTDEEKRDMVENFPSPCTCCEHGVNGTINVNKLCPEWIRQGGEHSGVAVECYALFLDSPERAEHIQRSREANRNFRQMLERKFGTKF